MSKKFVFIEWPENNNDVIKKMLDSSNKRWKEHQDKIMKERNITPLYDGSRKWEDE